MRLLRPLVLCAVALTGCGREPGADPTPASRTDWFVDRAAESGLVFHHFNGMSGAVYEAEIFSPGVRPRATR